MKKIYFFSITFLVLLIPYFGYCQPVVSVDYLEDYPNDDVYQITNYNVVDGKLYFFGGHQSGSSPYICSNKITVFDILSENFSELGFNLPYGIFDYCGASYYNNKFYLSPGFATGNTNGWGTHKKIIEVDLNTQISNETLLVNGGNIWNMSNIEVNGNIYFFGGHDGSDQKSIYEYNPQSDELHLVSNMHYKRNNSSLVYGSDGWIYILGDWSQSVNIERFSPSSYVVEDIGIETPVNKPYFYWHIASKKIIYFFDSYSH